MIIKVYKQMLKQKEYVLSKELLRSATTIRATIEETFTGVDRENFLARLHYSSREAIKSKYWLMSLSQNNQLKIDLEKETHLASEIIQMLDKIAKTYCSNDYLKQN